MVKPKPVVLQFSSRSPTTLTLWSKEQREVEEEGSVAGASLLFAGTAVGAGMLALPAETMAAGFVPTIFGLILCCIFTYVTSIIVLEASWLVSCEDICEVENEEDGGGFLLIARKALGVPGEVITAVLFWFLLTAIVVAYTSEGGQLISSAVKEVANVSIAPAAGSLAFASFFATLAIYGTSKVDAINRLFVVGLIGSFVGLVATGLPMVEASNLFERSDWTAVYPTVISIGILSFGAQNVVPTLFRYLNNNPDRTRRAILYGTLMPLVLYSIWEAVFIGVIDQSTISQDKMDAINVLGRSGGPIVADFVELFSICAIGSSMAGASVSIVDFFEDAWKVFTSSSEKGKQQSDSGSMTTRLFAAAIALAPPVILSSAFPDVFLFAVEEAGLLGGVSLYGLLPAISILALRGSNPNSIMPGRLGGGNAALLALVGLSSVLVLPEIVRLCSH
jgi:tyrosine-specific transport protein